MAIVVVGIGDDGPSGLGPRARAAVAEAELLVGGRRHLAFFPDHRAEKLAVTDNLDVILERLAGEPPDRRCVVLASGDPCYFGIGPLLAERLGRERVEIIPQPSSVALAFARLGLAWQDASVLSAHGRPLEALLGPALRATKLAILTDDVNTPARVAGALLEAGMTDCPAYVLEHLGGPAERIVETRLAALPAQQFDVLNVLVLLPGRPAVAGAVFGRPEAEFCHARGQITKGEARAVALSKLRLPPDGVLWDVGAGSGSLAIEAAQLMPRGTVYAVERDAEQLSCLLQNRRRLRAPQVRLVEGEAPTVLERLPRPDRVFVGGGGARLAAILSICLERLDGRGRLVVNAATLESVLDAEHCIRAAGWVTELVQLAVARGSLISGRTRLEALNPVFILAAWPEAETEPA